jgi:flagellar motor protein MotB
LEEINRSPASLLGGTKSGLRIPTWLLGIFVASGLTFVLGYYFPEQEANAVLTRDLKSLGAEYEQSVAAYQKAHVELAAVEKVRDEQKGALGAISDEKQEAKKSLSALYQTVSSSLEKFVKAKALAVEKRERDVAISLESHYLVYPHKTFVHDRGKQLLCEIAKALPKTDDEPTHVVAHVNGDEPWSGILKKEFPSTFQLSASVAAEVALSLATCGAPADRLRAVGAGHAEGEPKLAKKSVARVEIIVSPPNAQ